MDGTFIHPRVRERAMTAVRNQEMQLVANMKIRINSFERAIELTRKLRQTTAFAACDVVTAGYQQTQARLNAIDPTALPAVSERSAAGTPGQWLVKETHCELDKMDAIAQLAGGVAHEFNNILAAIVLNAELLENCLGKDNNRVQSLLRLAFRGSELTQKMLSFAGREQLNPRVHDLGSLVEGAQRFSRALRLRARRGRGEP